MTRIWHAIVLLLLCLGAAGCHSNGPVRVGMPEDQGMASSQGVHGLLTLGGLYTGSGVQWNEDYYVTARHIRMLSRASHACHCDLKFIYRPSTDPVPQWREAKQGEEIIALGYNTKVPLSSRGRILGLPVLVENPYAAKGEKMRHYVSLADPPGVVTYRGIAYQAHDAPLMGGMSGGAVISVETGEILGMNISFLRDRFQRIFNERHDRDPESPVSTYVPYSMIQAAWENYQREKRGEPRLPLPGQEALDRALVTPGPGN